MGFPTDPFTDFISNAPLAATPGASDMLALIQSGQTKRLPITGIPGLTPIVSVPTKILAVSTTYNILLTDYFIGINLSPSAAITLNLPSSPGAGRPLIIKDINGLVTGATPITIANGTVDGQSGYILPFPYDCIWIQSTGVGNNWLIISRLVG